MSTKKSNYVLETRAENDRLERQSLMKAFDSLDDLYAARWTPARVEDLSEQFCLSGQAADRFAALFTDEPPPAPLPAPAYRFFEQAGVPVGRYAINIINDVP